MRVSYERFVSCYRHDNLEQPGNVRLCAMRQIETQCGHRSEVHKRTTQAAAVADTGAHVASNATAATKAASRKKNAPRAKKGRKKAKKAVAPRDSSKKEIVVSMPQRKSGAPMAEIAKETGWQNHTIRGFMPGATKKAGYKIESTKKDADERCYRVVK